MSAHDHAAAPAHAPQAAAGAPGAGGAHGAGHGVHRNYVKIWAILLALLCVSVAGPFAGIRTITLITAFGVALVKAYMVAKNFMHLDVEKRIIHWLLLVVLVLMVLLFSGLSPDVMKDKGQNWKKDAGFHPRLYTGPDSAAGGHEHGNPGH
jgi:caa(3)-type oxidase subunit IV